MIWFYVKNGERLGPATEDQLKAIITELGLNTLVWTKEFGASWKRYRDSGLYDGPPPLPTNPPAVPQLLNHDDMLVRRIADYQRISGMLWIGIGIIQVLMIYTVIAGVWNVFAGISRMRSVKNIMARNGNVPASFEGVTQLVIIGAINLLVGGLIGVIFVAFDFFIRDKILSNRHLFDSGLRS